MNSKSHKVNKTIRLTGFLALLGLIVIAGFFSYNYNATTSTLDSLSLTDNFFTNKRTIRVTFENHGYLKPLHFYFDGRDVTNKVRYHGKGANLDLMIEGDGSHRLIVGVSSKINVVTFFPLERFFNFTVDTVPPVITITSPQGELTGTRDIYVAGKTEPCSIVTVKVNGKTFSAGVRRDGTFIEKVHLDRENNDVTVMAVDRAGNGSFTSNRLVLDESPPMIVMLKPGLEEVIDKSNCTISAFIADTGSGLADCYFEIDGVRVDGRYDPRDGSLTAILEKLDEGRYGLTTVAVDRSGHLTRTPWGFVVNTTEEPGLHNLRPGSIGKDVSAVQKRLVKMGLLNKKQVSGVYDEATVDAIRTVQLRRDMKPSGITDRATLLAISNKINIYLNEFCLYLISPDDKVIKRYPIACGSPYHPTPPGSYHVREKVYYPAWYPPPSPWARGSKPCPPGPGNPLGTRWIGLNADILGIHGTPSAWSIGSAASHGCIRMYIYQVEELFELVNVGTPVNIFTSRPDDHKKYKSNEEQKKTTASVE